MGAHLDLIRNSDVDTLLVKSTIRLKSLFYYYRVAIFIKSPRALVRTTFLGIPQLIGNDFGLTYHLGITLVSMPVNPDIWFVLFN